MVAVCLIPGGIYVCNVASLRGGVRIATIAAGLRGFTQARCVLTGCQCLNDADKVLCMFIIIVSAVFNDMSDKTDIRLGYLRYITLW